jgi:hypothetical protein
MVCLCPASWCRRCPSSRGSSRHQLPPAVTFIIVATSKQDLTIKKALLICKGWISFCFELFVDEYTVFYWNMYVARNSFTYSMNSNLQLAAMLTSRNWILNTEYDRFLFGYYETFPIIWMGKPASGIQCKLRVERWQVGAKHCPWWLGGGEEIKTTENKIHWSRCMLPTAIIIEGPMSRDFMKEVFFLNQSRAFIPQHMTMTPPTICVNSFDKFKSNFLKVSNTTLLFSLLLCFQINVVHSSVLTLFFMQARLPGLL